MVYILIANPVYNLSIVFLFPYNSPSNSNIGAILKRGKHTREFFGKKDWSAQVCGISRFGVPLAGDVESGWKWIGVNRFNVSLRYHGGRGTMF